jgi:hypothetical protein
MVSTNNESGLFVNLEGDVEAIIMHIRVYFNSSSFFSKEHSLIIALEDIVDNIFERQYVFIRIFWEEKLDGLF